MSATEDAKATLHRYLQTGRDAVVWKVEGLSPYDARRPLVRTGTNLLGLVKHLAFVELGYFGGGTFGQPLPDAPGWEALGEDPLADMWATAEESREEVMGLYRRACAHADATIEALPLDAVGRVPWWPADRNEVTLHQILVHVVAETHRHAGHADILREQIDGAVGWRPDRDNLPAIDAEQWQAHRDRLEQVARQARD